jgi:hypothetical protein
VLGPYALYAAFAAWHFNASDWFVLIVIVAGVILTVAGAVEESPQTLPSTADKKFLKTLEDWLRGQSEIMILIRYSREAGKQVFRVFYLLRIETVHKTVKPIPGRRLLIALSNYLG